MKTMPTLPSVIADLKSKGKENTRKIYSRHGMPLDRVLGVSTADMKLIAKTIKGQQALAQELYATGIMEAMYLAGMVADGSKMSRELLNEWAEGAAQMQMIAEYTVPWVTVENQHVRDLARKWIGSKKELVASAGWSTYAGLVSLRPDNELDLKEIEALLRSIVKGIGGAQNRVRYTMNGFVIAVGSYVKPLLKQAKAAARQIGTVEVNMGETACKVPLAKEYIEKTEAAGNVGRKRKTISC
jgi:3-methyladenine DNA glycosylase AlkD